MHFTRCTYWRRRNRFITCKTRKLQEIICSAMENVFFSEYPSCHRRAITLHLVAYNSLRKVLDKKKKIVVLLQQGYVVATGVRCGAGSLAPDSGHRPPSICLYHSWRLPLFHQHEGQNSHHYWSQLRYGHLSRSDNPSI